MTQGSPHVQSSSARKVLSKKAHMEKLGPSTHKEGIVREADAGSGKTRVKKQGQSAPEAKRHHEAGATGQYRRKPLVPPSQNLGGLIRPSHRLLLFSSQEYSMISQSGRKVKVRVFFQSFV